MQSFIRGLRTFSFTVPPWMHLSLLALLGCGLAAVQRAPAQSATWTGPDTGGSFHTAGNWSTGAVPGAASEVIIDGETATPRTVTQNGTAVVSTLTVSTGDSLIVTGGNYLQTSAVGLVTNGRLDLEGGADNRLYIPAADTVLAGSGEVRLRNPARFHGGGSLLLRGTVTGSGNIGGNELHTTNEATGRITANVAGQSLALDPRHAGTAPGFINQGRLQAADGGILYFSGYGGGWFDNTGGTIEALDGGEVQMGQSASVAHGTMTTQGTGFIRVSPNDSAYWTDVTNAGRIVVPNNSYLRCSGTITNSGSLNVEAAANATRFQLSENTVLTGSGRLVLTGSLNAQIGGGADLTNTGGHVIEGQGNVGINEVFITNTATGLIEATVPATALAVDARHRGTDPGCINRGTMQARNGGVLYLSGYGAGWFDNTGGTIKALDGSEVQMGQSASVAYGTLTSEGTGVFRVSPNDSAYWTDVTNAGRTVVPNNSFLRCGGTITNTATINIEAAANATRVQLNADIVLTGSGKVVLTGSQNAQIGGGYGLTNTGGHVIEGQGNVGVNEVFITNRATGLIDANVPATALAVDARHRGTDPGCINRGTMQARNGGVLYLTGYGAGWFDNTGGTIKALDGSEVQMGQSVSLVHGTLITEGTGFLRVSPNESAYWTDLTHGGRTLIPNNSDLRTTGTITNTGTINVEAAGNATRVQLNADTVLTGSGRVVLSGSQNAQIGGGVALTITGGQIIEGQGNVGVNEVFLTNTAGGVIEANVSGLGLAIDPRNRADLPGMFNRGTMQAKNGGVLYLSGYGAGWFDNNGGAIKALDGSEVQMGQSASVFRGTLSTEGTGFFRVSPNDTAYWTNLSHAGRTVVPNNAYLRTSGTIANNGVITLEAAANATRMQLNANTVLTGGGRLIMAGTSASASQVGGAFLLTNDNHTVEGHGNIGINEAVIFNTATGLIHANVSERGLTLDPRNGTSVTNRGILRASGGGTLYVSGYGGGGFDNFNGIIEALDASQVAFVNNPSLSGGVLRTAGGGVMLLPANHSMTLNSNTANLGFFAAENNSALYISGRVTNAGAIRLTGSANLTSMIMTDNTTLAGGGTVELNGNARISGGAVLIVEDQTIRGTGNIGWNEASISIGAHSMVVADVSGGTLSLDPTPIFGFVNDGIMRAENGGILNMTSYGGGDMLVGDTGRVEALEGGRVQFDASTNLINRAGSTLTGGTWLVQGRTAATSLALPGAAITASAATIVLDGTQAQFPQIAGLSSNSGSLALLNGASLAPPGGFTNSGALEIAAGSSLAAGAAVSLTPASGLTLHIGGSVSSGALNSEVRNTVAGQLTVVFDQVSGFTPAAGNSWTLLSGTPTGQFSQLSVRGLSSGLQASLEYAAGSVNLRVAARDGINFADWASLFDFPTPADALPGADSDRDGLSNLLEFAFGTHPLRQEPDAAPEPVVVNVASQPHLGLRYWKPAGAQRRLALTYAPERSPDAAAWSTAGIVTHNTIPADSSGRERITVRLNEPSSAAGARLLRMRVTQAP